jgi:ADP-heptose:LPS heptosyltransferase
MKYFDQKIRTLNHRRINLFRKWRLLVLKLVLDQRIVPVAYRTESSHRLAAGLSIQLEKPFRILILRTDGKLGDSITTSYLIEGLRRIYKEKLHLSVLSSPEYKSIFNGLVDDYIPLKLNFFKSLKFILTTRRSYDVLINSSHILNPSSVLLSRFIRATRKMVMLNSQWNLFSDHVKFDANNDHITQRYDAILKILSTKPVPNLKYSYDIDAQARFRVEGKLADHRQNTKFEKIIVLNSFAGARRRNFSLQTTKMLIEALSLAHPQSAIISLANSGDLKILRAWRLEIKPSNWTFFSEGDLDFNAALIERADVVVSPDTSIVHLACALNKKLVAVYRQDYGEEKNLKIWGPLNPSAIVVVAPKASFADEDVDINSVNIHEIVAATTKLITTLPN